MNTLPKRNVNYTSVFSRWDKLIPNKGILERSKSVNSSGTIRFDHLAHKPYAIS